jgi:hypothetical protein
MWKEAVVAWFKVLSQYLLEVIVKTRKNLRVVGLRDAIWTLDIPNTYQEC